MWRTFAILALVAFLLVSVGGNALLFQQSAANRADADAYRARLRGAQEARATLEARVNELSAENQQLRASASASSPSPSPSPASPGTTGPPGAPAPSTAAPPSATAGAAVAPDRVVLAQIEEQVQAIRGLRKKTDVPLRFLDKESLRTYFVDTFQRDYLPIERESDQKLLVTLGLMNPSEDLVQLLVELLQEQVIGVYNEDVKTMYVVAGTASFGPEEKVTFAHEFVHALQDQYYDLATLAPKHPENDDRSLAIHALIEGDAVLSQRLWVTDNLSQPEIEALANSGGDTSKLDQAPAIVRTELLFPYTDGFAFVRQAYVRAGSYAGVDDVFSNPPDSTEQVLHPDKYRAREQPVPVALPDLAAQLGPGWRLVDANTLGELDTRALLEQFGDRRVAQRAAAGWGGDRWALLEKDSRQAVVLKSTWDTENDAREFFDTFGQGLKNRFGQFQEVEMSASRQALTASTMATELRRDGQDVLAVLSFDRPSVEQIAAVAGQR